MKRFLAALLVILAVHICLVVADKVPCPDHCTNRMSDETCGYNGSCYKKFPSTCVLRGTNACFLQGKQKFEKVHIDECSKEGVTLCP